MMRRRDLAGIGAIRIVALAAVIAALLHTSPLSAQDYPTRPVTMVVPFAAGGPNDTLARIVAIRMSEIFGQQVVVENVVGAGGMVGSDRVARAVPDGYQFVAGSVGTHAQNQSLYKKPLYDAATDFTPVGLVSDYPAELVTRKDFPADTLADFVRYAKANFAKMTFGSAGAGSSVHIGCVVIDLAMGVTVTHVPYRGSAPALQDLQSGQIDFMCVPAVPQIQAGQVKAIAALTAARIPQLPDLPTAREQGFDDMDSYSWLAFFLPKNTPRPIVDTLNRVTGEALDTPWVRERVEAIGGALASPDRRSPAYLATFVRSEIERWAAPIRAAGVAAD
jgi:tripartite-type tricarboxylate transporter receptor subunit TctC